MAAAAAAAGATSAKPQPTVAVAAVGVAAGPHTAREPPIPAFNEYVPPVIRRALLETWSTPVDSVPGLRLVGPAGVNPLQAWGDVLTPDALAFVVDVYRATLTFPEPIALRSLLQHRKMKRAAIDAAGRKLAAAASANPSAPKPLLANVPLRDGSVALGFRPDTQHIRDDASWRVRPVPALYARFHDTMTGPPTAQALASALQSGISFYMADFEDSSTVALESLLDGLRAVTAANTRTLDFTDAQGVRHTVLPEAKGSTPHAEISVRFEGLHLPNAHFLYEGYPLPAHVVTVALYLWHNWSALRARGAAPVFYVPKLERMEEGAYVAALYRAAESLLQSRVGVSQYRVGTLVTFVIIEHCLAVFERDELLYALRDYACGCNTGWHDYVASIGAMHTLSLPYFQMPPKSNLQIVRDYLEGYQRAIVQTCVKRGAIPIGGMSGMVPPLGLKAGSAAAEAVEQKIRDAFAADFASQTSRGLRGVWLAHAPLAAVARDLIRDLEAQPNPKATTAYDEKLLTHETLLVTSLQPKDTIVHERDLHRNISDALQYTASYLLGNGNVALTRPLPDGTPVRLLDDAATLERSRREVASLVRWQKPIRIDAAGASGAGADASEGKTVPLTPDRLRVAMTKTFNAIKGAGPRGGDGVDIPFNRDSKNAYDAAFALVTDLLFDPQPVDYFTVLALRHLIAPFRSNASRLTKTEAHDAFPFLRLYPNLSATSVASIDFISNEGFAPAASLFRPHFPQFAPHTFSAQGQVYDGWETARHNIAPPDFVEFSLRRPARIHGVNIDTAHFDGNHGIGGSVEALVTVRLDHQRVAQRWLPLVDRAYLKPTARNFFHCRSLVALGAPHEFVQKLRLCMYPDGGIARLELYGVEQTDAEAKAAAENDSNPLRQLVAAGSDKRALWIANLPFHNGFGPDFRLDDVVDVRAPKKHDAATVAAERALYPPPPPTGFHFGAGLKDLALADHGGRVLASSSSHYSLPANMIQSGRAINMGDGWETKRMRTTSTTGTGAPAGTEVSPTAETVFDLTGPVASHYNWTLVALGGGDGQGKGKNGGRVASIIVDTLHYRNNPPVCFSVEGCSTTRMNGVNFYRSKQASKKKDGKQSGDDDGEGFEWYTLVPPTNAIPHHEHKIDVSDPTGATTHVLLKIYPCGGVSRLRVFATPATATDAPAPAAKL